MFDFLFVEMKKGDEEVTSIYSRFDMPLAPDVISKLYRSMLLRSTRNLWSLHSSA